ncbi:MAG: ATPase [Silicimonas sp.]|nr:ATPase [Silicimonas sp.]
MNEWATKRFWEKVAIAEETGGYAIRLDDRPIRTPAKQLLVVPTERIAKHIAAEWEAQEEKLRPLTMPWTRSANAALDKIAPQRREVMDHLIGYAGSDLLCYRAEGPEALTGRQRQVWDPILDWVADTYDARLDVTAGIMPIQQPRDALQRLAEPMADMSDFQLAGFHDMVALSGSYAIALAAAFGDHLASTLWDASRLDENWQIEQWGEDFEAKRDAEAKKGSFVHATELFSAARISDLTD